MDALDDVIIEIQETSVLPAEARNALHGATSNHPWCDGKSLDQRIGEVLCVIGGRPTVSGHLQWRVEKLRAPSQKHV